MKYCKDSSQECDDNKPSGPWPDGLYCSVTEPAENKQNQEKRKNKPSAPDLISDTNSKISFNQKMGPQTASSTPLNLLGHRCKGESTLGGKNFLHPICNLFIYLFFTKILILTTKEETYLSINPGLKSLSPSPWRNYAIISQWSDILDVFTLRMTKISYLLPLMLLYKNHKYRIPPMCVFLTTW